MQKGRFEVNNMTHLKGEALNVGFIVTNMSA